MTEEDDVFLKIFNEKREPTRRCSEDAFEATMNFFEETALAKQPYAAVDSPPVLPFSEMEEAMDAAVDECVKHFAKDIYDHWKSRRSEVGNRALQPSLKVSLPSHWRKTIYVLTPYRSLKPVKTRMTVIHMSASGGVKFGRFVRPVVVTRKVLRSFVDCVKSWKTLASLSHWCDSARLLVKR